MACHSSYRARVQVDERGYAQLCRDVRSQRTVAYNRYLLTRYHAHLNVEVCASVAVVAYLYKYVFKGADSATVTIQRDQAAAAQADAAVPAGGGAAEAQAEKDVLEEWLNVRYTSSSEAAWTAFEFNRTAISPACDALPVHMPNGDTIPVPADAPDVAELLQSNMAKLDHYRFRPPSGAACVSTAKPADYFAPGMRVQRIDDRLPYHQVDEDLRAKERAALESSGLCEDQVRCLHAQAPVAVAVGAPACTGTCSPGCTAHMPSHCHFRLLSRLLATVQRPWRPNPQCHMLPRLCRWTPSCGTISTA